MSHTEQLIARIKALATKTGKASSTLSAQLLGGGMVLADLEAGKTITLAKYERVLPILSEMEAAAAAAAERSEAA
jgi:hypothetical protein